MTKIEKECIAKRIKSIKMIREAYIEASGMSEELKKSNSLIDESEAKIIMKALDCYLYSEMENIWCLYDHIDCAKPEIFGQENIKVDNEEELPFT